MPGGGHDRAILNLLVSAVNGLFQLRWSAVEFPNSTPENPRNFSTLDRGLT
jgi:hypothetical protein